MWDMNKSQESSASQVISGLVQVASVEHGPWARRQPAPTTA
jgi:hypothetical protein